MAAGQTASASLCRPRGEGQGGTNSRGPGVRRSRRRGCVEQLPCRCPRRRRTSRRRETESCGTSLGETLEKPWRAGSVGCRWRGRYGCVDRLDWIRKAARWRLLCPVGRDGSCSPISSSTAIATAAGPSSPTCCGPSGRPRRPTARSARSSPSCAGRSATARSSGARSCGSRRPVRWRSTWRPPRARRCGPRRRPTSATGPRPSRRPAWCWPSTCRPSCPIAKVPGSTSAGASSRSCACGRSRCWPKPACGWAAGSSAPRSRRRGPRWPRRRSASRPTGC
jgi:hypothetical protein